jgi:hypothetical protein
MILQNIFDRPRRESAISFVSVKYVDSRPISRPWPQKSGLTPVLDRQPLHPLELTAPWQSLLEMAERLGTMSAYSGLLYAMICLQIMADPKGPDPLGSVRVRAHCSQGGLGPLQANNESENSYKCGDL